MSTRYWLTANHLDRVLEAELGPFTEQALGFGLEIHDLPEWVTQVDELAAHAARIGRRAPRRRGALQQLRRVSMPVNKRQP